MYTFTHVGTAVNGAPRVIIAGPNGDFALRVAVQSDGTILLDDPGHARGMLSEKHLPLDVQRKHNVRACILNAATGPIL